MNYLFKPVVGNRRRPGKFSDLLFKFLGPVHLCKVGDLKFCRGLDDPSVLGFKLRNILAHLKLRSFYLRNKFWCLVGVHWRLVCVGGKWYTRSELQAFAELGRRMNERLE